MERGKTFIFSGPSGVGKSTILKGLMEKRKNLYFSVSATTREPRPGEENGVDYHFLKEETFHFWRAQGEFLEYAQYVGNFYGTPKRYVDMAMEEGKDVILDIEVQGAANVREKCPGAVLVFIVPPTYEELERRLRGRGTDSDDVIRKRLDRALEALPTDGRPLSQNTALADMYRVRKPLYDRFADHHVSNDGSAEETADAILKLWEADV